MPPCAAMEYSLSSQAEVLDQTGFLREPITSRLEAITTIASRVEAIAIRVEAIAIRVEAVASQSLRWEYMASGQEWTPE